MNTIILAATLVIAVPVLAAVLFFLYLFILYPRVNLEKFPDHGGGTDPYEIRRAGEVAYLVNRGLPYPTHFDGTDHRIQSLSGRATMRFDPDSIGEREGWHCLAAAGEGWTDITLPCTYNAAAGAHTGHEGHTWFMVPFRPAFSADGERFVRLCFQGVLLRCDVWLNGIFLGHREGGYTPFYFDTGDALIPGRVNILTVRSNNRSTFDSLPPKIRDDHNPGWHQYGGIYREFYLELVPRQYVFKAVATTEMRGGVVSLAVDVLVHHRGRSRPSTLVCTVKDGARTIGSGRTSLSADNDVEQYRFEFQVKKPRFYSPASPATCRVHLELKAGKTRQRLTFVTGLRTVRVQGEKILLNGETIFLKGICKHEDDPVTGASQTAKTIARDLSLIKGMNANYIRLAHYPHHPKELAAARDMGLLLCEEIPHYQTGFGFTAWFQEKKGLHTFPARYFGCRQVCHRGLLVNARRQLIEMIERDRNNPAIIIWGVANETYTLGRGAGRAHGWLADIARSFDPTRPVTMAEATYNIPLFDNRRAGARHMDILSLNSYFGWYFGETGQFPAHLEAFCRRFPGKPVILSEFGADAAPGRTDADGPWKAERVGFGKTYSEEYQEKVITDYWNTSRKNPRVAGISPWVFSDFYNTWFPHNPVPNYNLKGVTSKERRSKRAYHALKKFYGADPRR
jgi:beta-glucuronidase